MYVRKIITLAIALFVAGAVFAQEKRTIKVIVPHKTDEVYITGNQKSLGNWNPNAIKMKRVSNYERSITLTLNYPAEFKFTKGDWESEGITNALKHNPNQKIANANSKNIFTIKGWSNDYEADALGLDYSVKQFKSEYLGEERLVKITLPENYDPAKKYPVFYTTDAGWNIFTIAKDYISNATLEEYALAPESILVGIVHGQTNGNFNRNKDLDVHFGDSGQNFKNFIFEELVPYIDKTYSTSGFNVMIGHSNGAEYNHYLLLEANNPFRGFISLSTNFYGKDVRKNIGELMNEYDGKTVYYFVANATTDSPDRIEAGNDYEKLYLGNENPHFQFKKETYKANHNSIVPLAMLDGIQFMFKDFKNFDNYPTFTSFKNNYLKDLKTNYGIDETYSLTDLDSFEEDIIDSKNKEDLDEYLQFIEDQKLWQNSYMKEPGGLDAANTGNFYYFIDDYKSSSEHYALAFKELEVSVEPRVYFPNLNKAIKAFKNIGNYEGLMNLLLDSKQYLKSENDLSEKTVLAYLLFMNYEIAKLSEEQHLNKREGKMAKQYCEENYVENRYFTLEELKALR